MTTGLMFFFGDNDLKAEIQAAAKRYFDRFGKPAELCLVHPSTPAVEVEGISIRAWRPVLPKHLWIGREDMPATQDEPA
jgi:hypothetical protein